MPCTFCMLLHCQNFPTTIGPWQFYPQCICFTSCEPRWKSCRGINLFFKSEHPRFSLLEDHPHINVNIRSIFSLHYDGGWICLHEPAAPVHRLCAMAPPLTILLFCHRGANTAMMERKERKKNDCKLSVIVSPRAADRPTSVNGESAWN